LVYSSQLQRPNDETPADDPLDEPRTARRPQRKLVAEHPELVERFRIVT